MAQIFSTQGLAAASARRPWIVVGIWITLFVVGGFLSSKLSSVLTSEQDFTNQPESKQAKTLLEERLRGPEQAVEVLIVQSESLTVDDAAYEAFVGELLGHVRSIEGNLVANTTSFYETGDSSLVSADRRTTILPIETTSELATAADDVEPIIELAEEATGTDGFLVLTSGVGSFGFESNEISEGDIVRGEMIGIPIALIILLIVLGAVVPAALPIILAFVAITVALGASYIIGQAFELSFFVQNMITMIGLAVGIDYALLIVQRYREERRAGLDKDTAIEVASSTASRAVLFSGITVILALVGMLLVPSTIFRSLGTGAILVVIAAVAAALTLLPAILSLLGDKIDGLRVPFLGRHTPKPEAGFWATAARVVMAKPAIFAVLTAGGLIALAVPYASGNFGFSGTDTFPKETDSYRAFAILDSEFNAGLLAPVEVVIDARDVNAPEIQAAIASFRDALESDPEQAFGASTLETNEAGDIALVSVPVRGEASSQQALDAVERVRGEYGPTAFSGTSAAVYVGGLTAANQDFFDIASDYQPIVFAVVLGLSFLLLMVVFRSVVVPATAIIMNLLSVGAAYGMIVIVFQHGVGNELLGFQKVEKIEAWLPLFLFSVLFGLSMDYHVFLLSRIRERYDVTKDNSDAVAFGLRSTASIITAAALIMVAVFSGFAAGQFVFMQQMGFGLAVAVIIDAAVIRTILVPATMQMLGDWNWYLPNWLGWLPKVNLEGIRTPQIAGGSE